MTGLVTVSARDAPMGLLSAPQYGRFVASTPLSLIATGYVPLKRGEEPTHDMLFLYMELSIQAPFTKKAAKHPHQFENILSLGDFALRSASIGTTPIVAYDNPAPGRNKTAHILKEVERWARNDIQARYFYNDAMRSDIGVVQVYALPIGVIALESIVAHVTERRVAR